MRETMSNQLKNKANGMEALVRGHKKIFRKGNREYYDSEASYQAAEKKYVNFMLGRSKYMWRMKGERFDD